MGYWDDLWNKVNEFKQDPIKQTKNLINKEKDKYYSKPEYYEAVRELEIQLDSIRKDKKNQDPSNEQALLAAGLLEAELNGARKKFDTKIEKFYGKDGFSPISYKFAMYEFTQDCNNAIHKYQPTLMAAPDIWSQIKASINNVAEQYLGIKKVFEMEKGEETVFSKNSKFKDQLNTIKEGKEDMEANENDEKFKPKQ